MKETPCGFTSMLQSLLEELLLSPERRDFSECATQWCTAAFSVENGGLTVSDVSFHIT